MVGLAVHVGRHLKRSIYTRFLKKYIVLLSAINTIEMQLLILRRTKEKVVFTAIFIFVEKTMPSA